MGGGLEGERIESSLEREGGKEREVWEGNRWKRINTPRRLRNDKGGRRGETWNK